MTGGYPSGAIPALRGGVAVAGAVFLSLMNKSLCVLALTAYRTVWILR